MSNGRQLIAKAMSEAELQTLIIAMAEALGYEVVHIRDSRGQRAVGLPDLMLMRAPTLIFAELKREKGRLMGKQDWFMTQLRECGVRVYLWRPSDWMSGTVQRIIEEGARR
ncbi:VRR-NUC domain-containing protein [uncultured Mediterranean phage uvDeep-CGR2-KM21-C338]|nr:VRR-NUC domain-containing protein [uncultured Mediterranean phage uvDeep-CGR2-KM21-C338]